jgi:ribosomal protein S18 acetylase RimI-like enzyme
MNIEIKSLQSGDEPILQHVAPEVFDHPINAAFTREFLADPRHHIIVAIDNSLVVGFASGIHYLHPDKSPELWINEVSVASTHRGQGLAKTLLATLLDVGRVHHCASAWVLTYRDNPAAMKLYSSSGGTLGADNSGPPQDLIGYSFRLTPTK